MIEAWRIVRLFNVDSKTQSVLERTTHLTPCSELLSCNSDGESWGA